MLQGVACEPRFRLSLRAPVCDRRARAFLFVGVVDIHCAVDRTGGVGAEYRVSGTSWSALTLEAGKPRQGRR